jgi:hypothetical protein
LSEGLMRMECWSHFGGSLRRVFAVLEVPPDLPLYIKTALYTLSEEWSSGNTVPNYLNSINPLLRLPQPTRPFFVFCFFAIFLFAHVPDSKTLSTRPSSYPQATTCPLPTPYKSSCLYTLCGKWCSGIRT